MVLHAVAWDTYERLLRDHANRSVPHFTFDQGTLEIMSPLPAHERLNRLVQLLLPVVAEATDSDLYSLGSTTFKREDLQRGFEGDSCFYVQNEARVRGKERIELPADPPPDLVLEVDITHSALDKLAVYLAIGVPEVWRFSDGRLEMLLREDDRYVQQPASHAFPVIRSAELSTLLEEGRALTDIAWIRRVRLWTRTFTRQGHG
jgi:Uma2 family endonuclease